MLTRRNILQGALTLGAGAISIAGYAVAEPFRLKVTRHKLAPRNWPASLHLKIAVLADLHTCEPWAGLKRLQRIVVQTNSLRPDIVLLLGDFVPSAGMNDLSTNVPHHAWAAVLANLSAPLGVYAVNGNHDWWEDYAFQKSENGPTHSERALREVGIDVFNNHAQKIRKDSEAFWLAGLDSQWAFWPKTPLKRRAKIPYTGADDLSGTLAQVNDDAPIILMAHEPDIFAKVPKQVSLTLSGHTHGGQVRLFGYSPVIPSAYGRRFAYGHIIEADKHLVVSGGLGCSGLPIRFGVPPEIVLIEVSKEHNA